MNPLAAFWSLQSKGQLHIPPMEHVARSPLLEPLYAAPPSFRLSYTE